MGKPKNKTPGLSSDKSTSLSADERKKTSVLAAQKKHDHDAPYWNPTDDEVDQVYSLVDNPDNDLTPFSNQLDVIYDVIPKDIHYVWTLSFGRIYENLAIAVQVEFAARYIALQQQHDIAKTMLPRYYPCLVQLAEELGIDVKTTISWDNVRPRLSQDGQTTRGKNWLEKLQSLLEAKVSKKVGSKFKVNNRGDVCEYNGKPYLLYSSTPGDPDNNDGAFSDSSEGDDVVITGTASSSKEENTTSEREMTPAPTKVRKRVRDVDDPSDTGRDDKKGKKDKNSVPDRQRSIDELLNEIGKIKNLSDGHLSKVRRLIDINRQTLDLLVNECGSLNAIATNASSSSDTLKTQRIKLEDDKKRFVDSYQRSYRAVYESYLQMRRLLFSHYWWQNLSNSSAAVKVHALSRYYNETHPWCQPTAGEGSHWYHSPEQPSATIDRSSLLTREETQRRWTRLLSNDIDGMSILQLPTHTQNMLVDAHRWSQTGIVNVLELEPKLAEVIVSKRSMADDMYDVKSNLKERNRHLRHLLEPTVRNAINDDVNSVSNGLAGVSNGSTNVSNVVSSITSGSANVTDQVAPVPNGSIVMGGRTGESFSSQRNPTPLTTLSAPPPSIPSSQDH